MTVVVGLTPLHGLLDGSPLFALLPSAFFPVVLILLLALVVLIVWMVWNRPFSSSHRAMEMDTLPVTTSVTPRALLSKGEATLLNLIRLAVQESYLVYAKLPVSNLVTVTEEDQEVRRMLLRTIQSARVDVALIHPGTLHPIIVIKFVENGEPSTQQHDRDQLVDAVLQAAGIEVIRVDLNTTYTMARLVDLFGLGETE